MKIAHDLAIYRHFCCFIFLFKKQDTEYRGRDGAVVRALASHHCSLRLHESRGLSQQQVSEYCSVYIVDWLQGQSGLVFY